MTFAERLGFRVNHKRVARLMKALGLKAFYPKPQLSKPGKEHLTFSYLLKDLEIVSPNQEWAADITYICLSGGFVYLPVIMDWYSRFVI